MQIKEDLSNSKIPSASTIDTYLECINIDQKKRINKTLMGISKGRTNTGRLLESSYYASKVVLIKFLQVFRTPMNWFKIPKYICKEIDGLLGTFSGKIIGITLVISTASNSSLGENFST